MSWSHPDDVRAWSAPATRDPAEGLHLATATLAAAGFAVTPAEGGLDAVGPPRRGTKESPLLGLGRLELRNQNGAFVARSDRSGGRMLVRFARWFPAGLSAVLAVVFATLGGLGGLGATVALDAGSLGATGLLAALPAVILALVWLPIGAWMARRIDASHDLAARSLLATIAGCPLESVRET